MATPIKFGTDGWRGILLYFLFCWIGCFQAAAQECPPLDSVPSHYSECGISIHVPCEYKLEPVVDNPNFYYSFGVKSKESGIAIRFAILPFEMEAKRSDSLKAVDSTYRSIDLRSIQFFDSQFEVSILNISGGLMYQSNSFPPSVKEEFGAEYGRIVFMKDLRSVFAKGYESAFLVGLRKEGACFAYAVFLFPTDEPDREELYRIFHCMRFN